jgi:vancomycin permeability regulator SanA
LRLATLRAFFMLARLESLWIIADHPPTRPGCFVIPSYALKDRFQPTRPTRAQIDLACRWWRRFPHASLIMCTGDNQGLGVTNAAVMARYAADLGVPRSKVIEENGSRNTDENLRYAMDIIRAEGFEQPTLVTLDLYTRRAVATCRKQGWQSFYWLSAYAEGEPAYGYKALQTRSRWTILGYEMGAMAYSKLVGWI